MFVGADGSFLDSGMNTKCTFLLGVLKLTGSNSFIFNMNCFQLQLSVTFSAFCFSLLQLRRVSLAGVQVFGRSFGLETQRAPYPGSTLGEGGHCVTSLAGKSRLFSYHACMNNELYFSAIFQLFILVFCTFTVIIYYNI